MQLSESIRDQPHPDLATVLLIDHEALVPAQLRDALAGHHVAVARSGREGVEAMRQRRPKVVLLDLHLPDQSGLEVYQQLRAIDPSVPVIFLTSSFAAETAIEAMKHGAYDYLYKPVDVPQLRRAVQGALEVTRGRGSIALVEPSDPEGAMLGSSPAMLEIYKTIGRVAAQDVPVLITGESGTGKELVARAIYQHSARAGAPFLALNCAAIPEHLLESELFGYEKGAFTGADRRRIGKFEQCDGGTILLDEIGEMPLALQPKLLRLLQEQRFERVGGSETIQTNVRIIAATNRDLRARAVEERFRADLYYRLGVFTIHLPPLRDRREDLPRLVQYFVRQFARQMARDVREVAPAALARLAAHAWPGNIRELQSVLRHALLNASGRVLHPMFLPELAIAEPARPAGFNLERFILDRLGATDEVHAATHLEVDRMLITRALERTGGNHRAAAKLLGISRQTMRVRMRSLGLYVAHSVGSDDDEAERLDATAS